MAQKKKKAPDFETALEELESLVERMEGGESSLEDSLKDFERGIELTPIDMRKFENAVDTASEKGAKNSLVLLDEHAFVVSVANRTVITALDSEGLKDQVVTDIDSAVII